MKRVAGTLALVLGLSLLHASDVRGGFGGGLTGKTGAPNLISTIVTDVTNGAATPGKGLTAIRVQKAGSSAAVLFESTTINQSQVGCQQILQERQQGFDRFVGLMDTWVSPASVRAALLGQFGNPDQAAITDTDYASCTSVDRGDGMGIREILSLTAVIQFQK
jgi:hypothetical protein